MPSRGSPTVGLSDPDVHRVSSPRESGLAVKAFLTAAMALLSLLVLLLACLQQDVFWLWLGFPCALVSGFFVQMFIERKKNGADFKK